MEGGSVEVGDVVPVEVDLDAAVVFVGPVDV